MPRPSPRPFAPLALGLAVLAGVALAPVAAHAARPGKGPWVQRVTGSSAVVRVEIDPPGPVTLEIAPAAGEPADGGAKPVVRKIESPEARDLHSIPVEALAPGTRYTYTVRAAGGVRSGAFTTAPPEGSTAPVRFLAYGDNRSDDAAHAAVVKAMSAAPGDFLVHTGDFVEDGASADDWQHFFEIEAPLLRERCLYSAVGNHELTDGAGIAYARYFGPTDPPPGPARERLAPEHLDGTVRWGPARFFFLNSMVELRTGVDRRWLEKALDASDHEPGLVWRILVMHHGLWSSGPHGNNKLMLQADVPNLLRKHKVDLIFAGHDHLYERGANEGLPYIITGGGGAPTYRIRTAQPFAKKLESARHFVEVTVDGETIKTVARRPDGTTLDTCELGKGRGWLCDAATAPGAAPVGSGAGTPLPPGAGAGTPLPPPKSEEAGSKCACRAVGAGVSGGPGATALAVVASFVTILVVRARRRRRPRVC